jgi:myo-inositol-1(or 4)-monophosphatase
LSQPDFKTLISVAHDLADRATRVILPHYRMPLDIENKHATAGREGFDPVTQADRAAERAIRDGLAQHFPDHAIEGEEYGRSGDSPWRWIIDPIDGTRAFMMGMLSWGTLIGLTHHGQPVFGMMVQPFTGERFWNDAQTSFWRGPHNSGILTARPCAALSEAVMACTDPSMFKTEAEHAPYRRLAANVKMSRFGGDCYAYAMLAAGNIDLVVEANLQSYDVAALIPIVERAGGRMTTWDGRSALAGGRIIAAGDPRLHALAMTVLAEADPASA